MVAINKAILSFNDMKIVYNNILPPKGYKAISILCFIFVKKGTKLNAIDINHEDIHWEQEKELLVLGFYVLYILFFIINLIRYRNWRKAYRSLAFEKEAYVNQYNFEYITNRKHYSWLKYL